MKAIVCTQYGPPEVLRLEEVEKPSPRDDEVLIKVHATTVTAADCLMRKADTLMSRLVLGLRKPRKKYRIMGIELAGVVEQTGIKVERFKVGDQVFGFTGFSAGAYAQYKCISEMGSIALKPEMLSHEEAAAVVDGATTALFFLEEKGRIQKGDKVLIIGASGSIGTAAVQLAKHFGAEVTGVCSTANLELVKSLGADQVVDYTHDDFTRSAETYDIIFDTVGKSSFSRCRGSLAPKGRYLVTVGGFIKLMALTLWTALFGRKRCIYGMSIEKKKALVFIKERVEAGQLRAVIDRRYPLDQMARAHAYVEKGHKKGNVVITVEA
jgi:NADPH:quinone reductase-like Zn-dependent oxidoreductase